MILPKILDDVNVQSRLDRCSECHRSIIDDMGLLSFWHLNIDEQREFLMKRTKAEKVKFIKERVPREFRGYPNVLC